MRLYRARYWVIARPSSSSYRFIFHRIAIRGKAQSEVFVRSSACAEALGVVVQLFIRSTLNDQLNQYFKLLMLYKIFLFEFANASKGEFSVLTQVLEFRFRVDSSYHQSRHFLPFLVIAPPSLIAELCDAILAFQVLIPKFSILYKIIYSKNRVKARNSTVPNPLHHPVEGNKSRGR